MKKERRRIKGYRKIRRGICQGGDMVWNHLDGRKTEAMGLIGKTIEYCNSKGWDVFRKHQRLTPPQKIQKKVNKIVKKYSKYDWSDNYLVLNLLDELKEITESEK